MAESHERTEEILNNELAITVAYHKGQLEELEKEGMEMAASVRKQMEITGSG